MAIIWMVKTTGDDLRQVYPACRWEIDIDLSNAAGPDVEVYEVALDVAPEDERRYVEMIEARLDLDGTVIEYSRGEAEGE